MNSIRHWAWLAAVAALLAGGCSRSERAGDLEQPGAQNVRLPQYVPQGEPDAKYRLSSEPDGAQGVAGVRDAAEHGQPLVVVGRVGGSEQPFVEGIAAFTMVDPSLEPCSSHCGCPTPWDYCCNVDQLKTALVMIQVVDERQEIVARDARDLLGIRELSAVVVRGKAKRDEAGNLTVLADGVYVRAETGG